jgi:two-component system heavy metal sensor histidine kinase CusS
VALRLTAWYVAATLLILTAATVALYFILAKNIAREQDEFLAAKVGVLRHLLRESPENIRDLKEEVEETWAPRQYAQVYARVLDEKGKVVVESPGMAARLSAHAFPLPVPVDVVPERAITIHSDSGATVRASSARAALGHGDSAAVTIQVALDTKSERDLMASYRAQLLLVLGIGLPICAIIGYWLARHSLRPLREIAATVQRIRSSNLDERIDAAGLPADLSSLAERFNAMLGRLQESFARLSKFSADIAHELRTPVNNMRIEVEVALGKARSLDEYRETLGSCLEECERLGRIIDSLLFIARAEDPRTQIHKEPVNVALELDRVREFYEAPAAEAGVQFSVSCPPDAVAPLDRILFQRAVSNLVANALRHTPPLGRVSVDAVRDNGELRVDVTDTGRGIAPDDLPHVFDRFYRADRARTSVSGNVGLGLAIVKSIVQLHGGSISAQSKLNEGTRMRIQIPAAAAEAQVASKS